MRTRTRNQFWARIGHIAQLGGTRHVILNEGSSKGVAAIEVDTGTGFCFTVLPDRGLDISRASHKGMSLVHLTPAGEVHPAFYDARGLNWLRNFFAGLLTTCGLTHLGPPARDGDEELGLHGRYANLPARRVQDRSGWRGNTYEIEIEGVVEEAALFLDKLRLTRTIRTAIGSRTIHIRDRVENFGFKPSPFTILYHVNAGFPLLDAWSELVVTARETSACNAQSEAGIGAWRRFCDPMPNYREQNFLHTMRKGPDGLACAAMINRRLAGGLGLALRFDPAELPYLNEWKMMGQGDYVVGIEPCNAPCESRPVLREKGLLPLLKAGEVREMTLEIRVLEGEKEITECVRMCSRRG